MTEAIATTGRDLVIIAIERQQLDATEAVISACREFHRLGRLKATGYVAGWEWNAAWTAMDEALRRLDNKATS